MSELALSVDSFVERYLNPEVERLGEDMLRVLGRRRFRVLVRRYHAGKIPSEAIFAEYTMKRNLADRAAAP